MCFGVAMQAVFDYAAVADQLAAKFMDLTSWTATSARNMPGPTLRRAYLTTSSNARNETQRLAGKSRIDPCSGTHQVRVEPETNHRATFSTESPSADEELPGGLQNERAQCQSRGWCSRTCRHKANFLDACASAIRGTEAESGLRVN